MTALDAYRNVLRELDKFESPAFTVGDFNYFFPSAVDEYVTSNYGEFEINQKSLDDLQAIVKIGDPLTFTNGVATLPAKYRHALHVETVLKFLVAVDGHAKDSSITVRPKRMRSNRKGYVQENAYQVPSYKNPMYQIAKGTITIHAGSNVSVLSGKLDYIEIPEKVYLNPDKSVDFTNPANNTLLQFPEYVNVEIIKVCKRIFLENIESQRYNSSLQEQMLRANSE